MGRLAAALEAGGEGALYQAAGRARSVARDFTARNISARGLSWGWPLGLIVAVLYGSLLPFEIDWAVFQQSNGLGLLRLGLAEATLEDIVTNILVYVPVGLALTLCGRGGSLTRLARVPFAVIIGAAVSLCAETLQAGIAIRVASWTDVALNTTGIAIGAILGAGLYGVVIRSLQWLRRGLSAMPTQLLATLVVLQVLAVLSHGFQPARTSAQPGLWPLQVVDLSRVQWLPFEALWRCPMDQAAADVLSVLAVYGTLALILLAVLVRARIPAARLVTGITVTLLAIAVEIPHMLSATHPADITGPILALLAAAGASRLLSRVRDRIGGSTFHAVESPIGSGSTHNAGATGPLPYGRGSD
ncbi:MAG: VanZ family protein [Phycisphaerae bacterium]